VKESNWKLSKRDVERGNKKGESLVVCGESRASCSLPVIPCRAFHISAETWKDLLTFALREEEL